MVPLRDRDLDPKSRVQNRDQNLVPDYGSIFWAFIPVDPQQVQFWSLGTLPISMWSQNRDQKLVPNCGSIFWTFLPMDPQQVHTLVPTKDHNLVPMHRSRFWSLYIDRFTFWTFMKVQNLDLGLKVLILQEGPHRSMKDHIGTVVMFYIRSTQYSSRTHSQTNYFNYQQ